MVRPLSCATEETAQQVAVVLMDDSQLIADNPAFLLEIYYDLHIAETRADAHVKLMTMGRKSERAFIDSGRPPTVYRHHEEGLALARPQQKHYLILQVLEKNKVNH